MVSNKRKSEMEISKPDASKYMSLGYKTKTKDTKHYRRYINGELEDSGYMGEDLFTTIDIKRGKFIIEEKGFFEKLISFVTQKGEKYRKSGSFRGSIEVIDDSILNEIIDLNLDEKERNQFELPSSINNWKYSKLDEEILRSETVVIRVYVIDAYYTEKLDYGSDNDSYMQLIFGSRIIKSDKKIENQNNPSFYEKFEFETKFPGVSDLTIKFWDEDPLKWDELIGETTIDLERRFFDRKWRSFKDKPIETRRIYHPSKGRSLGEVRLWIDIYPKKMIETFPNYEITPRPTTNLVLRVVVWEVHDVPAEDIEDVSDIYVAASLPSFDLIAKTDTHYRA